MNRNGSCDPCATAMKAPMPSLATSLGPSTSTLMWLLCFSSFSAAWANSVGVAWLPGRLAHSLASSMPLTSAQACFSCAWADVLSLAARVKVSNFLGLGLETVVV